MNYKLCRLNRESQAAYEIAQKAHQTMKRERAPAEFQVAIYQFDNGIDLRQLTRLPRRLLRAVVNQAELIGRKHGAVDADRVVQESVGRVVHLYFATAHGVEIAQ